MFSISGLIIYIYRICRKESTMAMRDLPQMSEEEMQKVPTHRLGCVMLISSLIDKDGNRVSAESLEARLPSSVELYHAKNKDHFWLAGLNNAHHVTVHHGFVLEPYEKHSETTGVPGKTMWEDQVGKIADKALDIKTFPLMSLTPGFFAANPRLLKLGEEDYFTINMKINPIPEELLKFRAALLEAMPYVSHFEYVPHVTIATVANEASKVALLDFLNETGYRLRFDELKRAYNIKK